MQQVTIFLEGPYEIKHGEKTVTTDDDSGVKTVTVTVTVKYRERIIFHNLVDSEHPDDTGYHSTSFKEKISWDYYPGTTMVETCTVCEYPEPECICTEAPTCTVCEYLEPECVCTETPTCTVCDYPEFECVCTEITILETCMSC